MASAAEDRDAIASGGVEPTHGRTMKEQKAWFLEKAAAHAKKVMAAQQAAATMAVATPDSSTTAAPPTTAVSQQPESASVADASAESCDDSAVSDGLQQLSLLDSVREAGGDVEALRALALAERRTELRDALKSLGFTGLQTRSRVEKELKAQAP